MKANRKLMEIGFDDDAVSPVIAVILMVAITVVLAATVFVLVSDIGGNKSSAAPAFNLSPDEGQSRLTVESAAQNADWNRLTVQADSCTFATAAAGNIINVGGASAAVTHVSVAAYPTGADTPIGTASATTSCGAAVAVRIAPSATKMTAGQFLEFCAGASSATPSATFAGNVKIVLIDTTANSQAYSYTFTNVRQCTT